MPSGYCAAQRNLRNPQTIQLSRAPVERHLHVIVLSVTANSHTILSILRFARPRVPELLDDNA
eukprot:4290463-Heterocapsa_arctica.AAC.1